MTRMIPKKMIMSTDVATMFSLNMERNPEAQGLQASLRFLALSDLLRKYGEELQAKHLLVGNAESAPSVRSWVVDRQVCTYRLVKPEDQAHDYQQRRISQCGETEENDPECGGCLLLLDVTGCEYCPQLCPFFKRDEDNIENEGNQQ